MRIPLWRQQGKDPDYRFSLANERTFLAWIRTALGLLAGGVMLEQFATTLGPPAVVAGLAIAFGGWRRCSLPWRMCAGGPMKLQCATPGACLLPWPFR